MAKSDEYKKPTHFGIDDNELVYLIRVIKVQKCFTSLTVARRAKTTSISTPWAEREYICICATSGTLTKGQVS